MKHRGTVPSWSGGFPEVDGAFRNRRTPLRLSDTADTGWDLEEVNPLRLDNLIRDFGSGAWIGMRKLFDRRLAASAISPRLIRVKDT